MNGVQSDERHYYSDVYANNGSLVHLLRGFVEISRRGDEDGGAKLRYNFSWGTLCEAFTLYLEGTLDVVSLRERPFHGLRGIEPGRYNGPIGESRVEYYDEIHAEPAASSQPPGPRAGPPAPTGIPTSSRDVQRAEESASVETASPRSIKAMKATTVASDGQSQTHRQTS